LDKYLDILTLVWHLRVIVDESAPRGAVGAGSAEGRGPAPVISGVISGVFQMSMNDDPAGAAAVPCRQTAQANSKVKNRWTAASETVFFEELSATCNVRHAAAAAGMHVRSAYTRRHQVPAFAARWMEALAVGYTELETMLLRHAIQGVERTETVTGPDGEVKQVKTVHSYPHALAARLLGRHADAMERYRAMQAMRRGSDPERVREIRAELALVRSRLLGDAATADE
jgi:hypothetical protein